MGQAEPQIEDIDLQALLADKAYDADRLIELLTRRRITPVIPPIAARYDKLARNFLACIHLAACVILLN